MPPTSRLLYYDLGMQADDDGVVEAFAVMRTTGANEDDLKVLATKGFVRVLNEDLVTYISVVVQGRGGRFSVAGQCRLFGWSRQMGGREALQGLDFSISVRVRGLS